MSEKEWIGICLSVDSTFSVEYLKELKLKLNKGIVLNAENCSVKLSQKWFSGKIIVLENSKEDCQEKVNAFMENLSSGNI